MSRFLRESRLTAEPTRWMRSRPTVFGLVGLVALHGLVWVAVQDNPHGAGAMAALDLFGAFVLAMGLCAQALDRAGVPPQLPAGKVAHWVRLKLQARRGQGRAPTEVEPAEEAVPLARHEPGVALRGSYQTRDGKILFPHPKGWSTNASRVEPAPAMALESDADDDDEPSMPDEYLQPRALSTALASKYQLRTTPRTEVEPTAEPTAEPKRGRGRPKGSPNKQKPTTTVGGQTLEVIE